MAVRIIAFPDAPRWVQDVQLDGRLYTLRGRYNVRQDSWYLDLETADGDPILTGVRAVLNWPLFRPVKYDDRIPPGDLIVVCPTGRTRHDPGREAFQAANCVRLTYVEAPDDAAV